MILLLPEKLKRDFFRQHTLKLNKRQNVIFALFCAESVFHLNGNKESRTCLDLVRKWLINPESVTVKESHEAAHTSRVSLTAWSAAATIYTVNPGDAANYAASTAYYATANLPNITDQILAFLSMLLTVKIPQTPYTDPLEILVYLTDVMDFPVLVQEDDKFRLNLWHKVYEFQVTGKIQDIADFCGRNFVLG